MGAEPAGQSVVRTILAATKSSAQSGDHDGALRQLTAGLSGDHPFVDLVRLAKALDAVDLRALDLRPLRLALVAASTLDHFRPVLRLFLAAAGIDAEVMLAPFDTVAQSALDSDSPVQRWRPDMVWLFSTFRDISSQTHPDEAADVVARNVTAAVEARRTLWSALRRGRGCTVIDNLANAPADEPFGNLAGAAPWGARTFLRRYNAALVDAAHAEGVVLFDLDHVAALWGKRRWEDPRYWFHSRHAFSPEASGMMAHAAARLIAGARGLARKCLVLDLDNTLWGGVIGDDGLVGIRLGSDAYGEAYAAFQRHIKALRRRGVILAVCSKNDPEIAASVFREHPDCVLRLDDFAVFVANWDNKADNIRDIARRLNIGLDALVFVDDNPMERDIVRRNLPEVAVVDLPEDPAGYIGALAQGGWFEAATFSREDQERTRHYAEDARRSAAQAAFVDMDAWLRGLEMVAAVGGADPFHLPRMAQLIGKSNQFHLTGTRYGHAELIALAERPDCAVRHIRLADRFGDNGLIVCLVLRRDGATLDIDTWVMSCRVLSRTVEEFTANLILATADEQRCTRLRGHYVPSAKNKLVAGLYRRLGFTDAGESEGASIWTYDCDHASRGWNTWVTKGNA